MTRPPRSMDCKSFRKKHLYFVDDTLPGVDVVQMQLHLAECPGCAGWDTQVRRSLLLARNHGALIEPSAMFRARLEARLARERAALAAAPPLFGARRRTPVWSLALGVGVISAAVVALWPEAEVPRPAAQLAPATVFGTSAAIDLGSYAATNATPAFIATVSSGMAILPALMLLDEAPALPAAGYSSPVSEPR